MRKLIPAITAAFAALVLSSCATPPAKILPPAYIGPITQPAIPVFKKDVVHIVAPGETLWRISKMYGVRMEDVMRANGLTSPTKVNMGARLLIPQAAPICPVIPLYRSDKWRYIIIHHSATGAGSSLYFNKAHMRRGFWKGVGYQFVIDNGSMGKQDGQIEVSPRWIKQTDGAHCKAGGMNHDGIGICLVGNFSREEVSAKQMESLVYLVNRLRRYYNIPLKNIMGHGRVAGARTECPGTRFPWKELLSCLSSGY